MRLSPAALRASASRRWMFRQLEPAAEFYIAQRNREYSGLDQGTNEFEQAMAVPVLPG